MRDKKGKVIDGILSKAEFKSINSWVISEKIDGMNIRIHYHRDSKSGMMSLNFYGRTDLADIPTNLLSQLKKLFTLDKMESFGVAVQDVWFFGEGYGNNIHKGSKYNKDYKFILFDIKVDQWWLEFESVRDISTKMKIDMVPILGFYGTDDAISLVKSKKKSRISETEMEFEGIVARSFPLMLFRDGTPIMWKLKVKDYRGII